MPVSISSRPLPHLAFVVVFFAAFFAVVILAIFFFAMVLAFCNGLGTCLRRKVPELVAHCQAASFDCAPSVVDEVAKVVSPTSMRRWTRPFRGRFDRSVRKLSASFLRAAGVPAPRRIVNADSQSLFSRACHGSQTNDRRVSHGHAVPDPSGHSQALKLYKKAFAAEELVRMGGPDGKIGHAEIKIGDSMIMLADEHPEMGYRGPKAYGGSPVGIHLYIDDVDSMFRKAIAAAPRSFAR